MPSPPEVRHLGCTKAFLRNLLFGPSQGPQFPALHLKRNILQRINPVRRRSLGRRDERRESRAFESDCSSEERGAFAERISDVFSESRASSLVEGFEKAAPAWPAKRNPAVPSVLSVSFDSLVPTLSPFGPTFGCSFSHLPRCSVVLSVSSVVKLLFFDPLTDFVRSFTSPIFRYGSSFPRTLCHQRLTTCASDPVPTSPRR